MYWIEFSIIVNEKSAIGIAVIYQVEWNATGLPSGVYFYQLQTNDFIETKKMLMIK